MKPDSAWPHPPTFPQWLEVSSISHTPPLRPGRGYGALSISLFACELPVVGLSCFSFTLQQIFRTVPVLSNRRKFRGITKKKVTGRSAFKSATLNQRALVHRPQRLWPPILNHSRIPEMGRSQSSSIAVGLLCYTEAQLQIDAT